MNLFLLLIIVKSFKVFKEGVFNSNFKKIVLEFLQSMDFAEFVDFTISYRV